MATAERPELLRGLCRLGPYDGQWKCGARHGQQPHIDFLHGTPYGVGCSGTALAFVYRFTNKPSIPDYVISGPTEFDSEALPYLISDGICRYLFHPSAGVEFSAYNDSRQCEFSIEIQPDQIAGGSYRLYKPNGGRVVKLHTLRVGDFFLADGHLLPYDADKEKVQTSNVVGIVFQTNPARVGDAEKKVLGGEAHALVMALKNAAVGVSCWSSAPIESIKEYLPSCNSKALSYNDISGYWNRGQILGAFGSFDENPTLKAADEYNKYYPVPATTTRLVSSFVGPILGSPAVLRWLSGSG